MKKKLLVLSSVVLLLLFSLVGCGGSASTGGSTSKGSDNSGGGSSSSAGGSSDGKQVTIQFEHWRGEDVKVFDQLIKKFEQENPNIKVSQTALPSQDYAAQVQTTLQGSNGADVFATAPGAEFNTLYKSGVYADLTGSPIVDRFQPSLIQAGQMNGKQYALPWQLVYNDPIYNMSMFKKLNLTPPKTWSDFLKMCQTLKDNGIIPIAWDGQISNTQFINPMLMNNMPSDDIFNKVVSGDAKLTDDWYKTTLSQIKELKDKGYFEKNANGTSSQGAVALFASGKAAMLAMGSYDMVNAEQLNPNLKIGVLAPITTDSGNPKYEGIYTSTFMLGINKNSKHIDAAKKFLDFLTTPENATAYANGTGQFLTEKGIQYTSKDLQYLTNNWLPKKDLMFQPRYTIPNPDVQKAVEVSVQNIIGGMSVNDAVTKAQQQVDQAIKK